MSENNDDSSPAVASAAVGSSSSSTKRSHKEMEEADKDETSKKSNSNVDDDALFASGMDRLKASKVELELAKKQMEDIRQQIRSKGNYEPDSLLYLCDGEDNHILSHIMNYLTIEDTGRCELVCHTLKKQAVQYWDRLDKLYFANHPTLRSPSAQSSREAVIRYKLASTLAERIGDMGDLISKHLIVSEYDNYEDTMSDVRVRDHCQGCALPDLDFNPFRPETSDDYEFFVRFCRTSDNKLLAEGFCPYDQNFSNTKIRLWNLDFSNWPQLAELTHLIETSEGDSFAAEHNDKLDDCMKELTAIVISVHKGTSKASLTLAQCNFGDPPSARERREHGIDNMGGHGFCWPKGCMSARSHGAVETVRNVTTFGGTSNTSFDNRYCDAKLGMLWDSHVWNDQESGQVLKVECHWTLDCNCNYHQREY